jgi:outer membrane protein OmpA-like peptidoglycan-associated protein
MMSTRHVARSRNRDEAEKPFWISFADLMTALMVLFLVVMGVALLAVTKTVTEQERKDQVHQQSIKTLLDQFEAAASKHDGIRVDRDRQVIDFGARAQFAFGKWDLNSEQAEVLRRFVPDILEIADGEVGRSVLKRVVVEGYTDKAGSYLSNLNLSLKRSQNVLCSLFEGSGESRLTNEQKSQVRALFFIGGYSFNAAKDTAEQSRRVEMRLEFLGVDEKRQLPAVSVNDFGSCGAL